MIRKETAPGQPDPQQNLSDSYLTKANEAHDTSVNFNDTNWRKQWENNLRMFQNRHIAGSKYTTAAYKYKSKLFRPKTRTAIRNNEAAGAAALFSSMDVVSVVSIGKTEEQKKAAKFHKALLTYRIAQPEMHWFLTVIGGLQDAQKMGVVCSHQYWKHSEEDPDGRPCVELQPIDRILFHPGANWIDPINSSPYLIRKIPMYIQEVKERDDWITPEDNEFQNALIGFNEDLTTERNQNRENPEQVQVPKVTDFSMVWVHEVFMREKGQDLVFYTLGKVKRLTEPKPRAEVYKHNVRPVTLGYYVLESHRSIAPGVPELGEQLQREANEIANSRQDNVKLALNKRYIIKRGSTVDIRSLLRNAAGSATMADDPEGDIKELEWNDVTRSSYEEQNRIDIDFDGLVGGFNAGTVKSQRSLNQTVGGMAMIQSAEGQVTDYGLKTFCETWYEPTLRQVALLEQFYESDEVAIAVAAEESDVVIEEGEQFEKLMQANLLITVSIGVGTSNPGFRLEKFIQGMSAFIKLVKEAVPGMDIKEIGAELFGYLGYKDGSRFFSDNAEDPKMVELQKMVEELQNELDSKVMENKTKVAIQQLKTQADMEKQTDQNVFELVKAALDAHAQDQDVRMQGLEEQIANMATAFVGNMIGNAANE